MDAFTWLRDNFLLPNTGPMVLEDEIATYYNDLVVIGRHPGTYTCLIKDGNGSVLHAKDYKGIMW